MSTVCINRTHYRRHSRELLFGYLFSCTTVNNRTTYFLSHIICVGTRTKTRTPIRGLEDRCTVRLCYASVWCASRDSNPEMSRGLNPPHLPFLPQAHILVPPVGVEPTKDTDS